MIDDSSTHLPAGRPLVNRHDLQAESVRGIDLHRVASEHLAPKECRATRKRQTNRSFVSSDLSHWGTFDTDASSSEAAGFSTALTVDYVDILCEA